MLHKANCLTCLTHQIKAQDKSPNQVLSVAVTQSHSLSYKHWVVEAATIVRSRETAKFSRLAHDAHRAHSKIHLSDPQRMKIRTRTNSDLHFTFAQVLAKLRASLW
jgi:hypothetical protein